jgi:drug/metabolite transporter (DMT)-like permease
VEFLALSLVLISAIIHAGWNLFSQQRQVTTAFFFIACLTAALALSPFLWLFRAGFTALPPIYWLCVIGSGVFEGFYYICLCGAYRAGDLSATYPLVRAVPVVMVALISLAIGGGREPQGVGLVGVAVVAVGCLLLPLASFRRPNLGVYFLPASLLAAGAGLATSGYSLADDQAMRLLAGVPTGILGTNSGTLFFLALKTLSSSAALGVILLVSSTERGWLRTMERKPALIAAMTGLFIFGAYGLVLAAMSLASNVSYVIAFRQLSIPLGAGLGFLINKETPVPTRLVGIGVITLGLVLVAAG